ncbi:MAG: hypothetical protein ACE5HK_00585 [Candidatus Methylomirabilales bacterium]
MPEGEGIRSHIVPVLMAALVCDAAVMNPADGKKNLIGIFDTILVSQFPTQRPVSVYFKVTDAQGNYDFEIRYVEVRTGEVLAQGNGSMSLKDRLKSSDFFFPFPPLPIPREGRYEFQLWANGVFIGSTFLDAIPRLQA